MAALDAQGGGLAPAQDPLEEEAADEVGSEDVGDETHDQRDREPLHGAGAELEQDGGGDERGGVRVEDGDPHPLEAVVDRRPDGLAVPQLLAYALEDEHVGVDADADREDDAGDAGEGEGVGAVGHGPEDRKSTRLNSNHVE